jgi:hypothetical protein
MIERKIMQIELKKYETEFKYLEKLRKRGTTNMYGAAPYLVSEFTINIDEARKILNLWMENYSELAKTYDW